MNLYIVPESSTASAYSAQSAEKYTPTKIADPETIASPR